MAKNAHSLTGCINRMGFKTAEFAELTGYSRQWLHMVSCGMHSPRFKTRVKAAVKLARVTLEERFNAEMKVLEERHAERIKAWAEMEELLLRTEEANGTNDAE